MFGKAGELGWTIGGHDISKLDLLISLPTSAQAADQEQMKCGAGGWLKRRQRFLARYVCRTLGALPMKSRMFLPALMAVSLFCLASASNARAGLFGHGGCEPSCGCEPTCGCEEVCCDPCCKPARVGLLARLRAKCAAKQACCEPVCCEPACEPTCGAEPTCGVEPACEPACEVTCCEPCCKPARVGLLARLRAKCAAKKACCCETVCCEPTCGAEPSCGCN